MGGAESAGFGLETDGGREKAMALKVINLRTARKRKAKDDAGTKAAENRARFGRTKTAKNRERAEIEKADRILDDHLINQPDKD